MSKKNVALSLVTLAVVAALAVGAAAASPAAASKFMVIAPHTPAQCLKALDAFAADAPGTLAEFEWGCMAGDHTGYAILSGENEEAVRNLLPASLRAHAKIVKLNTFTVEQIKAFHQKM